MVKVVSLRGGCARSTPLSMPQLLLIPTATRTLQMPCSKVNGQLSCSSAALLIHRSACSICCWCAIVKMEATITADCVGVTRIQGYRRTRHDALSAASKSAASGPGYSGNDARLQASARVCQLFVAPPVGGGASKDLEYYLPQDPVREASTGRKKVP